MHREATTVHSQKTRLKSTAAEQRRTDRGDDKISVFVGTPQRRDTAMNLCKLPYCSSLDMRGSMTLQQGSSDADQGTEQLTIPWFWTRKP